jgi:hypothetical protein
MVKPREEEALVFDCRICGRKSGSWCVYVDVKPPPEWHLWDSVAKRYTRERARKRYELNGKEMSRLHPDRFRSLATWEKRAATRVSQEYLAQWFREHGDIFQEGYE